MAYCGFPLSAQANICEQRRPPWQNPGYASLRSAFEIDYTPKLPRTATPCCHCTRLHSSDEPLQCRLSNVPRRGKVSACSIEPMPYLSVMLLIFRRMTRKSLLTGTCGFSAAVLYAIPGQIPAAGPGPRKSTVTWLRYQGSVFGCVVSACESHAMLEYFSRLTEPLTREH